MISTSDPNYPLKLKRVLVEKAPKTLHIWGNLDLLQYPAVGFCGSRNVTDKGLQVTADTVEQITALGWVTISGHARGVDTVAHRVTLENGGSTIIVIPQGIEGFKLRRELKDIASPERILIISEFPLKAGWSVGYAMSRNKTIIALSDAMVLIEAGMKGGTFNAGQQALQLNMPLFVADYELPTENAAGNRHFIQKGARRFRKSAETGKANIQPLREVVEGRHSSPANDQPTQLSLLDTVRKEMEFTGR